MRRTPTHVVLNGVAIVIVVYLFRNNKYVLDIWKNLKPLLLLYALSSHYLVQYAELTKKDRWGQENLLEQSIFIYDYGKIGMAIAFVVELSIVIYLVTVYKWYLIFSIFFFPFISFFLPININSKDIILFIILYLIAIIWLIINLF